MELRPKTITVCDVEQYDGDFIPDNLMSAIAWLQAKLEAIPVEFRAKADVDVGIRHHYDEVYSYVEITYQRPESDVELQQRLADEEFNRVLRENTDRQRYMELKRRFEGEV